MFAGCSATLSESEGGVGERDDSCRGEDRQEQEEDGQNNPGDEPPFLVCHRESDSSSQGNHPLGSSRIGSGASVVGVHGADASTRDLEGQGDPTGTRSPQ